jgi:hypothetical protein
VIAIEPGRRDRGRAGGIHAERRVRRRGRDPAAG